MRFKVPFIYTILLRLRYYDSDCKVVLNGIIVFIIVIKLARRALFIELVAIRVIILLVKFLLEGFILSSIIYRYIPLIIINGSIIYIFGVSSYIRHSTTAVTTKGVAPAIIIITKFRIIRIPDSNV